MYGECDMKDYAERIKETIEYLNSIQFPCADWKEDKKYFDQLEKGFLEEPTDEETKEI